MFTYMSALYLNFYLLTDMTVFDRFSHALLLLYRCPYTEALPNSAPREIRNAAGMNWNY